MSNDDDGVPIPKSTRYVITTCGHCPNAHVLCFTEDGTPLADFTVGPDQIDEFMGMLRQACALAREDNVRKQNQ